MENRIKFYGTIWCPDCKRAKKIFETIGCEYDFIDIDRDRVARVYVKSINNGHASVPTIVFPDGSTLTEPDSVLLENRLRELMSSQS